MRIEKEDFDRRIDNVSVQLDGKLWFVEADVTVTLCKTVYDGDWVTPDDWDIEVESIWVENMWLYEVDDTVVYLPGHRIVTDGKKQDGYDHINPGKIIDDLLENDDRLCTWVQERGLEIMP